MAYRSRGRNTRNKQATPPQGGAIWFVLILLIGITLRILIPATPLPVFLWFALLIGAVSKRYPQTRTKTEEPNPRKVASYNKWKNIQHGLTPGKHWLKIRRVNWWMGWVLGLLASVNTTWVLTLINMLFMFMSVQGVSYYLDRKKDSRHKYEGVSIPLFFQKASTPHVCIVVLIGVLSVGASVWDALRTPTSWQLSVALPCLMFLTAIWSLARQPQSKRWARIIDMQTLLDGWVATSALSKAYPSVYVTQVNDIPTADSDHPMRVIRFRIQDDNGNPMGNSAAFKLGAEPIRALAAPAGYRFAQLLGARKKGKGFDFDRSAMRLVLASSATILPDATDPSMNEKTVSLIADLAYQHTAELWGKRAPLMTAHNVSADPNSVAWLLEIHQPPEQDYPIDQLSMNWLTGDNESPSSILGLPIFSDLDNAFHLAANENTPLADMGNKWRPDDVLTNNPSFNYYVNLSRRYKHDMTILQNILGSKLPHPNIVYDNARTFGKDSDPWQVTITPVNCIEGATLADYAAYDLSPLNPQAQIVSIIEDNNNPVLIEVTGKAPQRVDNITGNSREHRLLAKTIIYKSLLSVLPAKATINILTCSQEGKDTPIWRVKFQLGNGATLADVRRKTGNIAAATGATHVYLNWQSADSGILWLTGKDTMLDISDINRWTRRSSQKELIELVLSNSWGVAGVYDSEGRTPVVTKLGTLPRNQKVIKARFEVPGGISVDKPKDNMAKFLTEADYFYGRVLPRGDEHGARLFDMVLAKHSPFPLMVKADWQLVNQCDNHTFPIGVDDMGEVIQWETKSTPHLVIEGKSRAGKSSAMQIAVAQAFLHNGMVILIDPSKGCMDFTQWAVTKSYAFVGEGQMRETEAALAWAEHEMRTRVAINKKYGVGNIYTLKPEDVDEEDRAHLRPLFVCFDEFNSYLMKAGKTTPNPNHDMKLANANAQISSTNNSINRAMSTISAIATQGCATGVHLILGAQRLGAKDLEKYNGNWFRSTGRILLGTDTCAGVITQPNVSEANRLQKSLKGDGGEIPKGRGLYENMGGKLSAIQTWFYSTDQKEFAQLVEHVPDVTPIDLTPYMPQEAEVFGEVSEQSLQEELAKAKADETVDNVALASLLGMDSTDDDIDAMEELDI